MQGIAGRPDTKMSVPRKDHPYRLQGTCTQSAESDCAAKVRVFITSYGSRTHNWDTVGVSQNVIEASWEAIVDSMEYYYNNFVTG